MNFHLARGGLKLARLTTPLASPTSTHSSPTSLLHTSPSSLLHTSPASLFHTSPASLLHTSPSSLKTFEPDYLDSEGVSIPTYSPINIQMKGYNFDVLEEFQGWVHRTAENMGVDVSDAWATPAAALAMTTFQAGGTRPKDHYLVSLYERNVQVVNMRSVDAPVLLDTIQRALPEGVTLRLAEHTVAAAEARWIADPFIDQIRGELSQGLEGLEVEKEKKRLVAEQKAARKRETMLKSLLE